MRFTTNDDKKPTLPRLQDHLRQQREGLARSEGTATPPSSSPALSEGSDSSMEGTQRKRPRFLSDIDRRIILQRIDNGEKQADLAREFGVTRAAICHLNKSRAEILTRFDILAKSPQGRQMIENYVHATNLSSLVRELRTPSVLVLLTRLRDSTISPATFKSTADRLLSILIEEALVSFGTKPKDVLDIQGLTYEGKGYLRHTIALPVKHGRDPLLETFAAMEPTAFCSSLDGEQLLHGHQLDWNLPIDPSDANVLLFEANIYEIDTLSSVLRALQDRGVAPATVCVVCVTISAEAMTLFVSRHRHVRLVTAAISGEGEAPQLARFPHWYFSCRA